MRLMNKPWNALKTVCAATILIVLGLFAYRAYGWPGLALAAGGIVMWVLLHMTRMLKVLQRAADRPVGTVASAVMLHSKLSRGMTLLQVLAHTRALGQRVGEPDAANEQYQWADDSSATVRCTFVGGKLAQWALSRT